MDLECSRPVNINFLSERMCVKTENDLDQIRSKKENCTHLSRLVFIQSVQESWVDI